jgi:hypothetical protein
MLCSQGCMAKGVHVWPMADEQMLTCSLDQCNVVLGVDASTGE